MRCRPRTKMSLADLYHAVKYYGMQGAGVIYGRKNTGNIPLEASKTSFHVSTLMQNMGLDACLHAAVLDYCVGEQ